MTELAGDLVASATVFASLLVGDDVPVLTTPVYLSNNQA